MVVAAMLTVVTVLFAGSITEATRTTGLLNYVAVAGAAVSGLYLVWIAVAIVFTRFVIATVDLAIKKGKKSYD